MPLLTKPWLQAIPQVMPSHVAMPFAGAGQGTHDWPHVFVERSFAQSAPHLCDPPAHSNSHVPLLQVAVASEGAWQEILQAPQWSGSFCRFTHDVPQSEGVDAGQPSAHV